MSASFKSYIAPLDIETILTCLHVFPLHLGDQVSGKGFQNRNHGQGDVMEARNDGKYSDCNRTSMHRTLGE